MTVIWTLDWKCNKVLLHFSFRFRFLPRENIFLTVMSHSFTDFSTKWTRKSHVILIGYIWIRITVVEYTQASRSNLCLFWRQNFHGFLLQNICRTNVTWNNYVSCVFAFCCSRSDLKTTLSLFYLIWRLQKGCVV